MENPTPSVSPKKSKGLRPWMVMMLLVYILAAGAFLRFSGINWDEDQHLHPDERFLTMVSTSIAPVDSFGEYFDTANSSLNPANRGYTFFVYGTLPLFITRYFGEWLGMTGYGDIHLVGRALSAAADLLTILLVFLAAETLYNRRVGLLAAAFYAVLALPIQQAHFYTVDAITSSFMMLAFYFAAQIAVGEDGRGRREERRARSEERGARRDERGERSGEGGREGVSPQSRRSTADEQPSAINHQSSNSSTLQPPRIALFVLFGLALGMATASKINAAPIAVILPLAAGLYWLKLPPREQKQQAPRLFAYLVLAAVVSVLAFRVFQPYAFDGLTLNDAWVETIKTQRAQASGDVDFPPALQWARRPLTFSWQNMTLWGLGLPMGLLAWAGFALMAWRMFKGGWLKHILLWSWTAAYFAWQSIQWNPTMRYQLPIYPLLAIIAAWAVVWLYDRGQGTEDGHGSVFGLPSSAVFRWSALALGSLVLLATAAWGYAFSSIYPREHTRIAASRWLFQEMPGPVTLHIGQGNGTYHQPLPLPEGTTIQPEQPYILPFEAHASGTLNEIRLPHVVDQRTRQQPATLFVSVMDASGTGNPLAVGQAVPASGADSPQSVQIPLSNPVYLLAGQSYLITLDASTGDSDLRICGPLALAFISEGNSSGEPVPAQIALLPNCLGREALPITLFYTPPVNGTLTAVNIRFGETVEPYTPDEQVLSIQLYSGDLQAEPLAEGTVRSDFAVRDDPRGAGYTLTLEPLIALEDGRRYTLQLTLEEGEGALAFTGAAAANESSWDDGLPLRIDGYDPYGGIYRGGLNFEMYWDDNTEKYERFVTTLDQADYILISSSRQWGSTTRVPERYPLTREYYHRLLGCPPEREIEWCYNVAEVGTFRGDLGFELIRVFTTDPQIGPIAVNDQPSEEAFTVYDHPKVFIFKKSAEYDPQRVRAILGAVDLSTVVRVTPKQADSHPGNLLLPPDRLAEQRSGGTWSDLFDYNALQNRYPLVTVALWYLTVSVLGWLAYPFVRFALPGLGDRGYPLSRIAGLLMLTYFAWLAGSVRIPFSRATIGAAFGLVALLGLILAWKQRAALRAEWRERRSYFLLVEGLFLAFFLFGLLVRFGNPDLWHPWKGGEKPMDFSYFNAVLKSTSFPPYDPWFAGGYINYYYYGFVIVGVLVKLLGIVPSIAYNLILPTLLAMIALGAFSAAWNLAAGSRKSSRRVEAEPAEAAGETPPRASTAHPADVPPSTFHPPRPAPHAPLTAGLSAALVMAVLGNLGTLQMITKGFKLIAAPIDALANANIFARLLWSIEGFFMALTGSPLPYRSDEWYWNPSRVIAPEHGNPITEFPYFTFLYGDLHAHLIALPIALLAISWALSVVLSRAWQRKGGRAPLQIAASLFLGGLAIGALYPTNLSDIYTYLPLGALAVAYALWMYGDTRESRPGSARALLYIAAAVAALFLLATFLYQPYRQWYGQAYSDVMLWKGTRTPLSEYLTHWGLFIFIFLSWLIYESIDWMASTPVSALRKLKPYRPLMWALLALFAALLLILGLNRYPEGIPPEVSFPLGMGVHVAWLVLPMVLWAGILFLRPGQSDVKRFALFLLGTGLLLTLMVELVAVSGDIGRMNTVFKFYLHTWALFAVAGAAAFAWLLGSLPRWSRGWRIFWQVSVVVLISGAALYPLTATPAKIRDRMAEDAPHTLDGMTYMQYAILFDLETEMDLSQDYNAIRWMQENVKGSPVIVEGQLTEYRWSTRYTIYTGLPGVLGWNWHQRQQRALTPDSWVWDRVNAIDAFYQTTDPAEAVAFLEKYDVAYIVLGQLERAKYAGDGLVKFEAQNGILWNEVYRDRETAIYEVVK